MREELAYVVVAIVSLAAIAMTMAHAMPL